MADKITASDLKSQKNDFVIIDVRESDELEGGVIEDSVHMSLGRRSSALGINAKRGLAAKIARCLSIKRQ